MKILLALPLFVLLGCTLAEEQSISTSTSCINAKCIDCLNGVCERETRVKREESQINSSTLHDACVYSVRYHQYFCKGFNCTDGSCIHHNDKREAYVTPAETLTPADEACHPGCYACVANVCYHGELWICSIEPMV
ncbi:hypothetical protein PENTCL1PPCAC_5859 [Pristionchus entomophagus]|uniref:Secreted protein n=1 Tax=Pristionchus entomophagus TaxID=358040 RepID=A0AAV5SQV4_9BILA|nr:hypothetical protein PENTCL1PPCAC_5859 [Pristionchus entomophagus]